MAYDPLSRSTRVTRTAFLVVGATSVVVSIFHIELKQIQGLDIPFPKETMSAALIIATCYLFLAFQVAFWDDILYPTTPEALRPTIEGLQQTRNEYMKLLELSEKETADNNMIKQTQLGFPQRFRELGLYEKTTKIRKQARTGSSVE